MEIQEYAADQNNREMTKKVVNVWKVRTVSHCEYPARGNQTSTAKMFPLILEGSHPEMTSVVKRAKGSEISVTETIR